MLQIKIILLTFVLSIASAFAQQNSGKIVVKGVVRDSISRQTLPAVTVQLKGTDIVVLSDVYGEFSIEIPTSVKADTLKITYVGFHDKLVPFSLSKPDNLKIFLATAELTLDGAVITSKRRRYIKRGNPAVELVNRVKENAPKSDPKRLFDHYDYQRYEKMLFSINDFKEPKGKQLKKLWAFADTSQVTGKMSLPLCIKERVIETRVNLQNKEEIVTARRSEGVDEKFSGQNIENVLKVVLDEIDIFRNDVYFVTRNFVSPLSSIATAYYKYYLAPDTVMCDGHRCVELSFFPFNKESLGFRGKMWIQTDSTYFVRKIEMNFPTNSINLNYVYDLNIEQKFERGEHGQRVLIEDNLNFLFKLISNKENGFVVTRVNNYKNYNFDQKPALATLENSVTKNLSIDTLRHHPISKSEKKIDSLARQMRKIPLLQITEWLALILEQGYVETGEKSLFDFGPVSSFISNNSLDGFRLAISGTTTPNLIKNLFLEAGAAYGFRDKKFKYIGAVEYSFAKRERNRNEFPMNAIRAQYSFNSYKLGNRKGDFYQDDILSLFKRASDSSYTYLRNAELSYIREFKSHFSFQLTARNYRQSQSPVYSFTPDRSQIPEYKVSEFEIKLRYAPHENIYETKRGRRTVEFHKPIWELSHTSGFKGFLGSDYKHNYTEFNFTKRFDMLVLGYVDAKVKAGVQWDAVPYMLLPIANTNQSYFISGDGYALMKPMEFMYDRFVSWNVVWNMNGLILNRIPLIKHLKFREIITCRGVWGTLTNINNPAMNSAILPLPAESSAIGAQPYIEIGVGIGNILKLFRVDYVRRITYTKNENIKLDGIMFGLSLKF